MKGSPPLTKQKVVCGDGYQWIAGLGATLRAAKTLRHSFKGPQPIAVKLAPAGLWIIVTLSRKVKLGIHAAANLSGVFKAEVRSSRPDKMVIAACGGFGDYRIVLACPGHDGLLRLTVTLTPSETLHLQTLPRDLCVLEDNLDPFKSSGRLMTRQAENAAAHAYFKVDGADGATVFYFQNLTALSDYFRHSKAKLRNVVAVQWPSAGFALPGGDVPLEARRPVTISDAFIRTETGGPGSDRETAEGFLNGLAAVYRHMEHPSTEYTDWPRLAQASLRTIVSCRECCPRVNGQRFFQAYVGSSAKPPEAMVQGAIIVPLMEYEEYRGRPVPLLKQLRDVPAAFYHSGIRELVRWLPGRRFDKEERSEEEHRFRMDSWYLLHTLLNYARMAEMGQASARSTFFKALPRVIETARHFNYDWPVFYDQRNLSVFKAETGEGQGGEQDVPGLYVKLMLSAYLLTHKPEYLHEAETAAGKLSGLSFGSLYQTNNTVMGAIGLARLWKLTGKTEYRDLSIVNMASVFSHLWLWNLKPGTRTFMALPPLHAPPYVALYEEAEILAGLPVWQKDLGDDTPYGARLLIAEYQKHLLSRAKWYYPAELEPDMVENPAKEGPVIRQLRIPLEGLGPPYD
jgi:hypothetical protein